MLIEQISYNINWKKFRRGYSFFIPCLDCTNAKLELLSVAKRLRIKVLIKVVIESGVRGIRTWKV